MGGFPLKKVEKLPGRAGGIPPGDGDGRLGGFSGEGDEIADSLLVVEARALHCLDKAGVGFIVEGDGHLADDLDEGLVAQQRVAAHAEVGGFGAQVAEAPGEVNVGLPCGRGVE